MISNENEWRISLGFDWCLNEALFRGQKVRLTSCALVPYDTAIVIRLTPKTGGLYDGTR